MASNLVSWREFFSDEKMHSREARRNDPAFWTAVSSNGVVTTVNYRATAAGAEILSNGGNAVDAAAAAAFALGVVDPASSGLGGMAMMLIHLSNNNKTVVLDGACPAPLNASPKVVAASLRYSGYRAVAVPTNVAVLNYALQHYGRLSRSEILAPAISFAEEGYPLTAHHLRITKTYQKQLARNTGASFFLDADLNPFPESTVFRQPVLAKTLRRLEQEGFEDFYTGEIARCIVEDMEKNGGFLCVKDLKDVPWPTVTDPLVGTFSDMTVHTLPHPGGGLVLLEMLHLFDELMPAGFDPNSPEAAVLIAGIIKRVRRDRRRYRLAGGVGVDESNFPDLASREYAKQAALEVLDDLKIDGETTHLCVMDRDLNVVSMTQSIERSFGAKVVTSNLGFLYNGYMRTFKVKNKKHPFYLRPGARARSNAAPSILFKGKEPRIAVGSTGSERLASGVFQVLVRLQSQTPFESVSAPRLHCTPEGDVHLEAERFSASTVAMLEGHGFRIHPLEAWSFKAGGLQLAVYDGKAFTGVGEPRRDGAAAGPICS
ncbi:MAG: hypothetical protein GTO29_13545 [Candidatus Latescibacteria bacterium]|nr:hypothetical protein [Candidatus Latescibacterota bacterium]NIO57276.1 hypothetical protein [Candidatus Latescibacterota bacterium]